MERDLKLLLGKILGETYRIQRRIDEMPCPASEQEIYGLVNGIEPVIDETIRSLSSSGITQENMNTVEDVLTKIQADPEKLNSFTGFYEIERELSNLGVDRPKAMRIIKYINCSGSYKQVIAKMNSNNSPSECKTFNLNEFDS